MVTRIELRQEGRLVGEHRRSFGRDQTVYDPWHYVPVLARKPGALRNGASFKDWILPAVAVNADGDDDRDGDDTTILTDLHIGRVEPR